MSESAEEAMPPEGDPETWDEMAARVTMEEVNDRYANQLARSMTSYMKAGFSHTQAFRLTEIEHQSRLEFMGQAAMYQAVNGEDPPTP